MLSVYNREGSTTLRKKRHQAELFVCPKRFNLNIHFIVLKTVLKQTELHNLMTQ